MLDTSKSFTGKFVEGLPNVEMKAEEQQETLDNLIKKRLISDTFLSFNKAEESPAQWFHWLDTFDQQNTNRGLSSTKLEVALDAKGSTQEETIQFDPKTDLPGWPLMSNKMQMLKCEKCSQEFCSPLNQRRHMRATHRRPLNGDKEDLKEKREQIAAYWDKLTPEEACEIVSFKNISLVGLSAASVIRALSTHLQQLLPQSYIKVATALLDIVQNEPLRFPLKSEELFIILDDASEKNTLYGVTSSSMQRCIFESEPGRVGLETKNLVASLGFLVELRLVKAWMDDKDVEALRCQKALVEEEEAAQKKREKLQERKRQKKMRQKESKEKERKGIESSTHLQEFKFSHEGDDSPTAAQSSPSSSGSSGPDANPMETSQVIPLDIEGVNNGKPSSSGLEDGQYCRDPDIGLGCFGHVASQELNSQGVFLDQRGKSRKEYVGGGQGWKDRRQGDFTYFPSHPKQPYSNDRRYYDHQYGGQRLVRTTYSTIGSSAPEFSRMTTPRYNHREKFSGLKRPTSMWTRKAPQMPASVSQHDKNAELDVREVVNDPMGTILGRQFEHLKTNDNSCSANPGKCEGLSQDSALSLDSVTSHSSGSVSARVGAEEQENLEDTSLSVSFSTVTATAGREASAGSGALVIGSVMIPLRETRSSDPVLATWARESEVRMESEEDVTHSISEGVRASSSSAACVSAEGALQVVRTSCLDASRETSVTLGGVTPHQLVAGGESTAQLKSHWPNVLNKPGMMKVWRPVTPGEPNDSLAAGLSAGIESTEEQGPEAANISVVYREEGCADPGSHVPDQPQPLTSGSDGGAGEAFYTGHRDYEEAAVIEGTTCASKEDYFGQQTESLVGALIPQYSDIASFLCQRWLKAISSSDVAFHRELDDLDNVSPPLSEDSFFSHSVPDD